MTPHPPARSGEDAAYSPTLMSALDAVEPAGVVLPPPPLPSSIPPGGSGQKQEVLAAGSPTSVVGAACILLVEDDVAIRTISQHMLSRAGYHVDAVANGLAGWERLRGRRYDLLITDNQLPGFSGLELVRRARTAGLALPVVFASGGAGEWTASEDISLQPFVSLAKPFSPTQLVEAVGRLLPPPVAVQDQGTTSFSLSIETYSHWGLNE